MVDRFGYYPVFIGYGIMPLIAVAIMLFLIGPLRPDPNFQTVPERSEPELPKVH
jgi:hypothetical protein